MGMLASLDGDCLGCIFPFLSVREWLAAALVCKRWAQVIREAGWKPPSMLVAWGTLVWPPSLLCEGGFARMADVVQLVCAHDTSRGRA